MLDWDRRICNCKCCFCLKFYAHLWLVLIAFFLLLIVLLLEIEIDDEADLSVSMALGFNLKDEMDPSAGYNEPVSVASSIMKSLEEDPLYLCFILSLFHYFSPCFFNMEDWNFFSILFHVPGKEWTDKKGLLGFVWRNSGSFSLSH